MKILKLARHLAGLAVVVFAFAAHSPLLAETAGANTSAKTTDSLTIDGVTFHHIRTQFIAALAEPDAKHGTGAQHWGLWRSDPGPRGVWLQLFPVLRATGGYAPGNWKFDADDWWLDENGLIMPKPEFPLPAGRYLVTGEREVTTMLTVHEKDANGEQRWELAEDATLFEVTHMPCRSARYTQPVDAASCTPANADKSLFKIAPGSEMPAIPGCEKQDYAVLIVVGMAAES